MQWCGSYIRSTHGHMSLGMRIPEACIQIYPTYHPWWYFVKLQAHQEACWSCPVVAPFWTGYSPACPEHSPACPEQSPAGELRAREPHITTTTNALCLPQIFLPGLSSRNLLRMWMVAFCQVLSSLWTAAVSAAICVTTLSNSALLTHCSSSAV